MFFVLFILNFFIDSMKHGFFLEQKLFSKIQFPNTIFFFRKHKKLFSKTVFQNNFKKQKPNRP